MIIIKAKYILICNENFDILEEKAIAFDENIKDLGKASELLKKYKNASFIDEGENSLLMPAFINNHCHLEYSSSVYQLEFGDFLLWLKTVMKKRDDLSASARNDLIKENIKKMQRSGIATIGEISSFGGELEACSSSKARIIFFNELLGRLPNKELLKGFENRFKASLERQNELFAPALSAHSPYSTHPKLLSYITKLAKEHKLLLSTHFLESDHENIYLRQNKGLMKKWLASFSDKNSFYTPSSYIQYFKGLHTLFTHCVYSKNEFELFEKNHFISHCPRSNALLAKKKFPLKLALKKGLKPCLATDGLSSNNSLNMLDELRAALFLHESKDIASLAQKLILMATKYPAKSLALKSGELKKGFKADLALFKIKKNSQIALNLILHTKEAKALFINGEQIRL